MISAKQLQIMRWEFMYLEQHQHVDDLLKSVSNVATAIRLLNDVIEMCAADGFRLTKIISNRIEVLQSTGETEI